MITQLTDAGFRPYSAKTAEQKAHIQSLPPDKITKVNRQGRNMWVYPDPANNKVYVGNRAQYQAFGSRVNRRATWTLTKTSWWASRLKDWYPVEIYDGFVPMNNFD